MEQLGTGPADGNYVPGDLTVAGDLTVDDLTCQGSLSVAGNVGFNGRTPAARPSYAIANLIAVRAIDVNAATLGQVRAVLGTLLADLKSIGLLQ